MKYVKMLGLAAVAAMALMAFVGAGTASAAKLYSTGVEVKAGSKITASLEKGTSSLLTDTSNGLVDTCTTSEIEGTVSPYTSGDVTVVLSKLHWTNCSFTTDTLTLPDLTISSTGTVKGNNWVVTINPGATCRFGLPGHLGNLTTSKVAITAVINEQEPKSIFCPDTMKWVANYTVTSPHDLTAGV